MRTISLITKKRVAKSIKAIFGIATILLGQVLVSSAFAWGPERATYTNEHPADYATFNSITDNVAVGDERNFVRVRELGTDSTYTDEVEVAPGKEYEVYIYFHNDAASNTNQSGVGVATNTRVASAYPTLLNPNDRGMISGILSWSYVTPSDPNNAKTGKVWDEAYLTTKAENVVLRYKTGTAIIHNDGDANGSVLPTALFTEEGTPIGFNKLTGTVPGCAEYSGYITYTLIAENTTVSLDKKVSLDGENWSESVSVDPNGIATYWVTFKNTGNTTLTNVIFKDSHDEKLSLVSGTTKVYDSANPDGKQIDDILDISGYNVGDVAPGALVQLTYQLRVANDADCGKNLKNVISADYNSTEKVSDEANVTVKGNCDPTPTPEDCTTNPNLPECQTIPDTGPVEIILAIIIVLGLCGAGFYFWRTHKKVKAVENKVSGKTEPKPVANKAEEKTEEKTPKENTPEVKPDDKKPE
ncbi:DUF11 domain-containing protein [Candidatus Saccharibacteria bacterium]|nr:DUF11 domain-containing protein [Candidatus Saccharibacteria bacterium]